MFLLHGTDDNVIPAVESEYLADDLRGHAPVRLLLSGLISHAEADRPMHAGDVLQLAGFWGDCLLTTLNRRTDGTRRPNFNDMERASTENPLAGRHRVAARVASS